MALAAHVDFYHEESVALARGLKRRCIFFPEGETALDIAQCLLLVTSRMIKIHCFISRHNVIHPTRAQSAGMG